jgi:hypothetical protein
MELRIAFCFAAPTPLYGALGAKLGRSVLRPYRIAAALLTIF